MGTPYRIARGGQGIHQRHVRFVEGRGTLEEFSGDAGRRPLRHGLQCRAHYTRIGVVHCQVEELTALRPYALLSTESFDSSHDAASTSFDYRESGTIRCRLVQDVPQEIADDHGEIGRRFDNVVGGIMDDLAALSGKGGYLAIERMEMPEPWTRTEDNRQATDGDAVTVDLLFNWGPT